MFKDYLLQVHLRKHAVHSETGQNENDAVEGERSGSLGSG